MINNEGIKGGEKRWLGLLWFEVPQSDTFGDFIIPVSGSNFYPPCILINITISEGWYFVSLLAYCIQIIIWMICKKRNKFFCWWFRKNTEVVYELSFTSSIFLFFKIKKWSRLHNFRKQIYVEKVLCEGIFVSFSLILILQIFFANLNNWISQYLDFCTGEHFFTFT